MAATEIDSKPVVLITGGTGYLASHIIDQLLRLEKYRVRATVRPGKFEILTRAWPTAMDDGQLTVVEIPDIATSDFTSAFKGVSILLHVAATVRGTGRAILDGAVDGTTNVIQYALQAGVKKIVYTSSFVTLFDPGFKDVFGSKVVSEDSWGKIMHKHQIDADKETADVVYGASKTLAERKFWELADANPGVDFTAILPSAIFGNLVPTFPTPIDRKGLGFVDIIYSLIAGGSGGPNTYPDLTLAQVVHVSDVARAHILAMTAPPLPDGRQKRIIMSAPELLFWPAAAQYLGETRPELADRLPSADAVAPKQTNVLLSNALAEEALGMKAGDYRGWRVIVDDGIDEGLRLERRANSL